MAWKFDNPWLIDGLDNAEGLAPAYDGRHLWVAQADGSIIAIDFWGPYSDVDNDAASARYLAEEHDYVHATSQGPAVRVKATFETGVTEILAIGYYLDTIYVLGRSATHLVLCKASTTNVSPSEANTFGPDESEELGVLEDLNANSEIAITNGYLFFVTDAPEEQTLLEGNQYLVRVDLSDYSMTQTAIESTKQLEKRFLAVANDALYVSSFNTLSVKKFNATTGAYISSVAVNRDVERVISDGNDVYVVSSRKGVTSLGPASMVSKIDTTDADSIEAIFGVNNPSNTLNPVTMACDTGHVWFTNAAGGYQKTRRSDNRTIAIGIGSSDMQFDFDMKGVKVVANEPVVTELSTEEPVTHVFIAPATSYEWFDGTDFVEIDVPAHLFLIQELQIVAVALRNELKFEANFEIGQYTAVSTGAYSYKGD